MQPLADGLLSVCRARRRFPTRKVGRQFSRAARPRIHDMRAYAWMGAAARPRAASCVPEAGKHASTRKRSGEAVQETNGEETPCAML
jgi:hypothetical protein